MSLDVTLLQVLKHRKYFERIYTTVNSRALDAATAMVIQDFARYFKEMPDTDTIPLAGGFRTWFCTVAHPNITDEQRTVWSRMLLQAAEEPPEGVRDLLVARLVEADAAVQLSDLVERYVRGEEVELMREVRARVDDFEQQFSKRVTIPFVDMEQDLFNDDQHNIGFKWRLSCLNMSMRPLRAGDFGIVAARPDKGKTTFGASEVTHMAAQLDEVYGAGCDRPILWLNNEGPGERIVKRLVQSALHLPTSQLVELYKSSKLWPLYEEAIRGHRTKIRVLDVHGYKHWQIEEIIKQCNPALVWFDMIDNVQFGGVAANGGSRTDQLLETMYQWGRDCAVKYKCPIIAASQISHEGDGMAYPPQAALKDSKTGKQGAADFIVTLGAKNEPGFESIRFIGLSKNKLQLEGRPYSPKAETILDGTGGRYIESAGA